MLPACRTEGEGFTIPTFDVTPRDVEGFMEELWGFSPPFTTVLPVVSRAPISLTIW